MMIMQIIDSNGSFKEPKREYKKVQLIPDNYTVKKTNGISQQKKFPHISAKWWMCLSVALGQQYYTALTH